MQNPYFRLVAVLLIPCLLGEPGLAEWNLAPSPVSVTASRNPLFQDQAIEARLAATRFFSGRFQSVQFTKTVERWRKTPSGSEFSAESDRRFVFQIRGGIFLLGTLVNMGGLLLFRDEPWFWMMPLVTVPVFALWIMGTGYFLASPLSPWLIAETRNGKTSYRTRDGKPLTASDVIDRYRISLEKEERIWIPRTAIKLVAVGFEEHYHRLAETRRGRSRDRWEFPRKWKAYWESRAWARDHKDLTLSDLKTFLLELFSEGLAPESRNDESNMRLQQLQIEVSRAADPNMLGLVEYGDTARGTAEDKSPFEYFTISERDLYGRGSYHVDSLVEALRDYCPFAEHVAGEPIYIHLDGPAETFNNSQYLAAQLLTRVGTLRRKGITDRYSRDRPDLKDYVIIAKSPEAKTRIQNFLDVRVQILLHSAARHPVIANSRGGQIVVGLGFLVGAWGWLAPHVGFHAFLPHFFWAWLKAEYMIFFFHEVLHLFNSRGIQFSVIDPLRSFIRLIGHMMMFRFPVNALPGKMTTQESEAFFRHPGEFLVYLGVLAMVASVIFGPVLFYIGLGATLGSLFDLRVPYFGTDAERLKNYEPYVQVKARAA